jgi:signal transduction histidine kinase
VGYSRLRFSTSISATDADVLAVEVIDDGQGSANGSGTGAGHGLRGMAERVLALGGELDAGPVEPHGWRVFAELPIGQRAS